MNSLANAQEQLDVEVSEPTEMTSEALQLVAGGQAVVNTI